MWRKQRGRGEDQRESAKLFHCFCCKARVFAGVFYCGSQELQKGACRGDEKMRERRARYVWRLDTRVLYFLSVCERVFIISVHKRYTSAYSSTVEAIRWSYYCFCHEKNKQTNIKNLFSISHSIYSCK